MSQTPVAAAVDIEALVRPAIRSKPSYIPATIDHHGEPPARVVKLDMNESPYGPSPRTLAALASFAQTNRYPSFTQDELRDALAGYTGVPADRIVPGAGMDDVWTNVLTALVDPGDEVVISEPTFGVYRALVGLRGGTTVDVPLRPRPGFDLDVDGILAAVTARTKLIVVCDPNNPTGNRFDPATVERLVAESPTLVVIDEAYAEFGDRHALALMARYPHVAVLRTMSKWAGLAGMRVGYGIFPPDLAPHVWSVTPAFCNVSTAAAAAAIASLDDRDHLLGVVARIKADRDALTAELARIPGVEPYPSETNFILARVPVEDAGPVIETLARRGVHVRSYPSSVLGLRDCLRVTVGTPEENDVFLAELRAVLSEVAS